MSDFSQQEDFTVMPEPEFDELCARRVSTLHFATHAVRINNVFSDAKIITIGQLIRITERELLKYRNLGKKSLQSVKDALNQLGGICPGICAYHVGPKELETFKQLHVNDQHFRFEGKFEHVMSVGGITWQLGKFFPRKSLQRKLPKLLKDVHLQGARNTTSTRREIRQEFIRQAERMFKENHIPWV